MTNYEGVEKGEICNRNGCAGIIEEHETDTTCSCHNHPPCSHCTTMREYCPTCGWDAEEERAAEQHSNRDKYEEAYARQGAEWDAKRNSFYAKYHGKEKADKLEFWHKTHTHFSMIWMGVFPPGTETSASILPHVQGSFGGRFTHFDSKRGTFEYIAYTD